MEQRRANENHLRRLKPPESLPPPQQPPQKCPRCDSINTKFCYYNNYSLSQPRYFCKTCRRYWTQGGTLRNVPVGGGCRKGKRAKTSPQIEESPTLISRSETSAPQTQLAHNDLGIPSSRYPGGGFFSSLPAMQSFGQTPPPQNYSNATNQQPTNLVGSKFGPSSSNLDLLRGFNSPSAKTTDQRQQPEEAQFYQFESNPFDHTTLIQPNMPLNSPWSHTQLLLSTTTNPNSFWNTTATSSAVMAANDSTSGSSTLNPTPWPDLPTDYGNPP